MQMRPLLELSNAKGPWWSAPGALYARQFAQTACTDRIVNWNG